MEEFINLTENNIANEHLCCIIRSKIKNEGVEQKRVWLKDRIKDGHVFRKLNAKATVFIEYAPLDKAFVPFDGDNYYYLYCLWVTGEYKGLGYGKKLMEYMINDAKQNNKSGICMLGSEKQKAWLSNQAFAIKYGFKVVDSTLSGYQLLALSFDGSIPKFNLKAKSEKIDNQDLTIYYSSQCPFIYQKISEIKEYCDSNNIKLNLIHITNLIDAKNLPCIFNNWAIFYKGNFITVNILNVDNIEKIIKK